MIYFSQTPQTSKSQNVLRNTILCWLVGLFCLVSLSGCERAQEYATEKLVETLIEGQLTENGSSDSNIDLSDNGFEMSSTDENGKLSKISMAKTEFDPKEIGIPLYPSAAIVKESQIVVEVNNVRRTQLTLESEDNLDNIASFYRDQAKSLFAGEKIQEMFFPEGFFLIFNNAKTHIGLEIVASKRDANKWHITLTRSTPSKTSRLLTVA